MKNVNILWTGEKRMYPQDGATEKICDKGKIIVIYHGWGSTAAKYDEFAQLLTSLGFTVIVPEIIYHDSREKLKNHFAKEILETYFWKTIFQSIDEAPQLFDELDISEENIILMGVSMGGFIASGIYGRGNHFAGLISVNASGSFQLSEQIFRENDHRPSLSAEEKEKLNEYNPIGKNWSVSPVLFMHGDQDTVVSIDGQKDYYSYVSNHHDDVMFHTYKEVNHTFTERMERDLIQWLERKYQSIHSPEKEI